jgi:hypothetical protein
MITINYSRAKLPVELATAVIGLPGTYFGALHLGLAEPTKANADLLLTSIAFGLIVFAAAEGQCLVIASRLKRSTFASTDLLPGDSGYPVALAALGLASMAILSLAAVVSACAIYSQIHT